MKKRLSIVLAFAMAVSMMCGCKVADTAQSASGQTSATKEGGTKASENKETEKEQQASEQPGEKVHLKWAVKASEAGRAEFEEMAAMAEEACNVDIEIIALPDPGAGEANKLLISLMAGDEFDIVEDAYSNMKQFYEAGVIEELGPLAEAAGYDVEKIFGDYPAAFDGKIYGLPAYVDKAITIYNKDVFDQAGVSYPEADDWTWEKFIEIGKKLTDEKAGIYGAYNPDWVHYNYMYAMQKGFSHYKEDGSSNYDDPLFKESVKWYYDLGNTEKIQPSYLVQKSKQMPVDYFTTGRVGMSVCGGWTTNWIIDKEKYPRDWKAGVLPMPHPEGEDPSVSVVVSNVWIPATSKNKEKAFDVVKLFAEKQYTLGYGRIPARIDLTDDEIQDYIRDQILPALEPDGITVEDIQAMWFDPDVNIFDEKPVGTASTEIKNIIVDECGLYGIGEQSLDDTVAHIKTKADAAIETASK